MPCRRAEKGNDSSYGFLQLPPQFQNGDTKLGEMEQKLAVPYSDVPSRRVWQKCKVNLPA